LTLVQFRKVEYNDLPKCLSVEQSKEKRGEEITRRIVESTQIAESIEVVAYLNATPINVDDSDNNSYADSANSESVSGIAVKNGKNTWTVVLKNQQQTSVTDDEIMNPSRFFVKRRCLMMDDVNANERKKQAAKQKRARMTEKIQKEQSIHERAKEEMRQFE